jgi:hypothetical protein
MDLGLADAVAVVTDAGRGRGLIETTRAPVGAGPPHRRGLSGACRSG